MPGTPASIPHRDKDQLDAGEIGLVALDLEDPENQGGDNGDNQEVGLVWRLSKRTHDSRRASIVTKGSRQSGGDHVPAGRFLGRPGTSSTPTDAAGDDDPEAVLMSTWSLPTARATLTLVPGLLRAGVWSETTSVEGDPPRRRSHRVGNFDEHH